MKLFLKIALLLGLSFTPLLAEYIFSCLCNAPLSLEYKFVDKYINDDNLKEIDSNLDDVLKSLETNLSALNKNIEELEFSNKTIKLEITKLVEYNFELSSYKNTLNKKLSLLSPVN